VRPATLTFHSHRMRLESREQEGVMATETVVRKQDETAVEAPKAAYVKKTYSPEFLAEQAVIDKRVREEGAKRIRGVLAVSSTQKADAQETTWLHIRFHYGSR
jgi:hypothetical protein